MTATTKNGHGLRINIQVARGHFTCRLDLSLPTSGVTGVFGPSGCGKTTLLRCVAGLERHTKGTICFVGTDWQSPAHFVPAHKRPIGYVFQEPSLLPHLSVRDNLLYGWKRGSFNIQKIAFDQAVEMLGLASLLDHFDHQLSGGQKQRVGIARALLTGPELLLMDEPLANLDDDSRAEILPYLDTLHTDLHIPIVYVSHSMDELSRIADHLVLMGCGEVKASGSLASLLTDPDLGLAKMANASAVVEGRVTHHDGEFHLTTVSIAGGQILLSLRHVPLHHSVRLRLMASDVSLTLSPAKDSSISNILRCDIIDIADTEDPAQVLVRLNCGGDILLSRVTRRSASKLNLRAGQSVYAQVKTVSLMREPKEYGF